MIMFSDLKKEYILPTRIMAQSENIVNADALLTNRSVQVFLQEKNVMACKGKGYVLLDFGKEMHGGVRILTSWMPGSTKSAKVRLRFGESVGEACAELGEKNATNDHSARDFEIVLPQLACQEYGQTGFRFVRIDFLEENTNYQLLNVYAASTYRDVECKGSFECSDPLVNEIYETAKRTLLLNMQGQLWEGIKRDRLVWVGDLQPEVLGVTCLLGEDEYVENALSMSVDKYPLPSWFGDIPAYSMWFIQILCDYYKKVRNTEFVLKYLPYMEGILGQIDESVSEDGVIDFAKSSAGAGAMGAFLDWPTYQTKDACPGNRFLFIYILRNMQELYADLGVEESPLCQSLLNRLQKVKETDVDAKQVVAFGYLAGQIDAEEVAKKLTKDGAKALSTYMSYFIFKAIAGAIDEATAIEYMKAYYGGMLSRGATSFWEDFDIAWLENSGRIDEFTPEGKLDLHGDFGAFCYIGFRHSLCHGWSCGPVQYLTENVLGVTVTESGCRSILVKPSLGNLAWCKGTFPTPYGIVEISHEKQGDKVVTKVNAPEGVKVTVKNA